MEEGKKWRRKKQEAERRERRERERERAKGGADVMKEIAKAANIQIKYNLLVLFCVPS